MSDAIEALREAVRVSPDNIPLRKHLADSLLNSGDAVGAETEYRAALALSAKDADLQIGLASAFWRQGKTSEALVLLEPLVREHDDRVEPKLMLARIYAGRGELDAAHTQYAAAVDIDPSCAEDDLADAVGYETFRESDDDDADDNMRIRISMESGGADTEDVEFVKSDTTFSDVGGMESLKEQIRLKVIYPIANAELFAQYGKTVGGSILMYGPPGCGKTHIAKATAGEIEASFLSVEIDDVLDMYLGNSEQKLATLFEQARRHAPSVIFFDEVDALGATRRNSRQGEGNSLVNKFLAELDGIKSENSGMLILAATNAPWTLDGAFRRPGRFDEILFVPPPDEMARIEILRILLLGKPVEGLQLEKVAKKTNDFTGADLKAVIDRAIEAKLQQAMKTGKPEPITTSDLVAAAKKHKPTCREWLASARNHALYGNESGLYDDVFDYLKLKK